MINVWLKIRNRGNLDFVLKHLNFWMASFSNENKYKIYLYNEDVNLPENYGYLTILNRHSLLQNPTCKQLNDLISKTNISHRWKLTAFALAAPYYYLNDHEYIVNVDADDILMLGNIEYYIDKVISIMHENNLPTLSYDYIYSFNTFDGNRNVLPHHWAYGVNISKTQPLKQIIDTIMLNIMKYSGYLKRVNIQHELNLDMLTSAYLATDGNNLQYHTFITKEGFLHRGFENFDLYHCKWFNGQFCMNFRGQNVMKPLHSKTILIE